MRAVSEHKTPAVLQRREQEHFPQEFTDAFQVKLHCEFITESNVIIFYNKIMNNAKRRAVG